MKKRYHIYVHKNLSTYVDVAAESVDEAKRAVQEAIEAHALDLNEFDVEEYGVDDIQPDEGDNELDYVYYEVNEDGELVEVE